MKHFKERKISSSSERRNRWESSPTSGKDWCFSRRRHHQWRRRHHPERAPRQREWAIEWAQCHMYVSQWNEMIWSEVKSQIDYWGSHQTNQMPETVSLFINIYNFCTCIIRHIKCTAWCSTDPILEMGQKPTWKWKWESAVGQHTRKTTRKRGEGKKQAVEYPNTRTP